MNKRQTNIRRDNDSGVEVKVTMGKHECDVVLTIPFEKIMCQTFGISNKDFQFKITTHSTPEDLPEKLVLNFVGKYTKVEYGLLKSKQLTFKFRGNGYNGYLVLNPKFYIPDEKRFTPEKAEKIAAVIEERRVQVGRGSNAC